MSDRKTPWYNQPWLGTLALVIVPLVTLIVVFGGLPGRMSKVEERMSKVETKIDSVSNQVSEIHGELKARRQLTAEKSGGASVADARPTH
jgi:uncharacterized membrane protein